MGLTRRRFLALSATLLAAGFSQGIRAQNPAVPPLRIALVAPTRSGRTILQAQSLEIAGALARMGTLSAGEIYGQPQELTRPVEVLIANAPDAATATRFARRLTSLERVTGLIGGFGTAHAQALATVANERNVPFLNIGESGLTEPRPEGEFTFHVEPGAHTYLQAISSWFGEAGWYVVHQQGTHAKSLLDRFASHSQLRGNVAVAESETDFRRVLAEIRAAQPELVLLLLPWLQQLDFVEQYEQSDLTARVTGYPDPVTQTREFLTTARERAPATMLTERIANWDAGLTEHGADELNSRFYSRWGYPFDAPAWAAYQAVNLLVQAAIATGDAGGPAAATWLSESGARFSIGKKDESHFSAENHELEQAQLAIRIRPEEQQVQELLELRGWLP